MFSIVSSGAPLSVGFPHVSVLWLFLFLCDIINSYNFSSHLFFTVFVLAQFLTLWKDINIIQRSLQVWFIWQKRIQQLENNWNPGMQRVPQLRIVSCIFLAIRYFFPASQAEAEGWNTTSWLSYYELASTCILLQMMSYCVNVYTTDSALSRCSVFLS